MATACFAIHVAGPHRAGQDSYFKPCLRSSCATSRPPANFRNPISDPGHAGHVSPAACRWGRRHLVGQRPVAWRCNLADAEDLPFR